jgi:uncharacterized cupin superfamily protein
MGDPNIWEPEWERASSEPPFLGRATRVGAPAGSRELGASLYEMEAGGAVSPYHLHHGNEELLVVLSGRPRLRTTHGTRRLEPGAVVAFLPGPSGAHRVSNPGPEPARVLIVSTMHFPEVAEHVSTGTTMAMTGPAEGKIFAAGSDQPFIELFTRAMAVDAEFDESQPDGPGAGS